ncbi:hypothetical protein BDZ89DRAFT_1225111 [Hymenopellis radicata]|nr:hypothetical protein BDZ89DRAFT_1225111 [Hymenopellis radicata]
MKTADSYDDPTRAYCLTKLEEVFRSIFLRYSHVNFDDSERLVSSLGGAKQFAKELEHCIFEIYCESDSQHAGAKYKDHFRTLQSSLSKVDRVVLHKCIVSRQITPKEIFTMSSTDLADEETKQSIKFAEQEALEHSILQKTTAPHTKITHRGCRISTVAGANVRRKSSSVWSANASRDCVPHSRPRRDSV